MLEKEFGEFKHIIHGLTELAKSTVKCNLFTKLVFCKLPDATVKTNSPATLSS